MSEPGPHQVTHLLQRLSGGDRTAEEDLYKLLYHQLHRTAEALMRRERPDHTLQATALVNDAFVQLVGNEEISWEGRTQFLAVASGAMRRLLVDHARRRGAQKRGGDRSREALDGVLALYESPQLDLLALDEALRELEVGNQDAARMFELRFFGNLTNREIATDRGVSLATAERGLAFAKAWPIERLGMHDLHGAG